jgi:hypothetical protein
MYYAIALTCTLIAWCAQSYTTIIKKEPKLNVLLPLFYFIACIGYAMDSFLANSTTYGIIDVVLAILALLIFIFMLKGKK